LLVQEGSNFSGGISFSFEIKPGKIDKGEIYVGVCGIALEESSSSVLLYGFSIGNGINVEFVPTSVPVILLEDDMGEFVRGGLRRDFVEFVD
jgi:hypothetical protein